MWNWISTHPLATMAICIVLWLIMLALNIWLQVAPKKRPFENPQMMKLKGRD